MADVAGQATSIRRVSVWLSLGVLLAVACVVVVAANDVTAVEEVPPEETGRVPVHRVAVAPRYFGIAPPLALFALAVASLVIAVVLFAAGKTIAGAVLLAASVLFSVLFVAASR